MVQSARNLVLLFKIGWKIRELLAKFQGLRWSQIDNEKHWSAPWDNTYISYGEVWWYNCNNVPTHLPNLCYMYYGTTQIKPLAYMDILCKLRACIWHLIKWPTALIAIQCRKWCISATEWFLRNPHMFLTFVAYWVCDIIFRMNRCSRGEMLINGQKDTQTKLQKPSLHNARRGLKMYMYCRCGKKMHVISTYKACLVNREYRAHAECPDTGVYRCVNCFLCVGSSTNHYTWNDCHTNCEECRW